MSSSSDKRRLAFRFLVGGTFNTLFGLTVIFALMALGVSALAANVAGYAIGILVSFAVNRGFVFRRRRGIAAELPRYVLAFLASFAANLAVLHALTHLLLVNAFIGQIAAIALYVAMMFWLCQAFVFRPSHSSSSQ